ncbi:hypothetical protein KEM52_006106 [Ascosphaera acerosa]|nr:hypothetical protein KEM52_006106 [Ascosphaera acerosa]
MARHPAIHEQAATAVLDFLAAGAFPDDEAVVAAEFDTAACATTLQRLRAEQAEKEAELSTINRTALPEVTAWIEQAKRLQEDIERSKSTARDIVSQHEVGQQLRAQADDASRKVGLLRGEVALNEALTAQLRVIKALRDRLAEVEGQVASESVPRLLDALNGLKRELDDAGLPPQSSVVGVLKELLAGLEKKVRIKVIGQWRECIQTVCTEQGQEMHVHAISQVVGPLEQLGILDKRIGLLRGFLGMMLRRALRNYDADGIINVHETSVTCTRLPTPPPSVSERITRGVQLLHFVQAKLPEEIATPVISPLTTLLSKELIPQALRTAMPTEVSAFRAFQRELERIRTSVLTNLRGLGCTTCDAVEDWSNDVPRLWLQERRALAVDETRNILWRAVKEKPRTVDFVETRAVPAVQTAGMSADEAVDQWAENWGDDGLGREVGRDEDRDAGSTTAVSEKNTTTASDGGIDEPDDSAWGWDDDNLVQDATTTDAPPEAAAGSTPQADGTQPTSTLALTERYSISQVPDRLLALIVKQIDDSRQLASKELTDLRIAQCSSDLLSLPSAIVTMFRAIGTAVYSRTMPSGSMYLHNDCVYLAGRLREASKERRLPQLTTDADEVEQFGKECYSAEMRSRRLVLSDLVDGAKGFGGCAQQPKKEDCEIAIASICEHIRAAHAEWRPVLWETALMQAVAGLLSTVVERIIVDIEDLSDISANDSACLVELFGQISRLEQLFFPEDKAPAARADPDTAATVTPRTAVFVPKWLKFQYLVNILDSSLADIKYLWMEGELSLEFGVDEVVDLLEALFADSEHRRRAITEIRRSAARR